MEARSLEEIFGSVDHYMDWKKQAASYASFQLYEDQIKEMREDPSKGDYCYWARRQFVNCFFDLREEKDVWTAIYRLISKHRNVFNACIKKVGYAKNGYGCAEKTWDTAVRVLYTAAIGGSRTAIGAMRAIYKEYFSDEYLILERDNSFSHSTLAHVKAITDRYELSVPEIFNKACRLLCMAEILELPIDHDHADRVYAMAKYFAESDSDILFVSHDPDEKFKVSNLPDRRELAAGKEFMDNLFATESTKENLITKDFAFIEQACHVCGYRNRAVVIAGEYDAEKALSYTGALLKRVFPSKTSYSKSEAALFYSLFSLVKSITDQNNAGYKLVKEMLRQIDLADDTPEEVEFLTRAASAEMIQPEVGAEADENDSASQLEDLKKKLALLESEAAEYREQAHKEKKRADKLEQELHALEDDTSDVAALRSFVYNMTEQETPAGENLDERKHALKGLKIIVVGGHPNWVKRVQPEFPEWRFVSRKMSSIADVDAVAHIDCLLFNTDCLGHKDYYKWINEARRLGVKIGYLSGMNLQNTIRQACDVLAEQ